MSWGKLTQQPSAAAEGFSPQLGRQCNLGPVAAAVCPLQQPKVLTSQLGATHLHCLDSSRATGQHRHSNDWQESPCHQQAIQPASLMWASCCNMIDLCCSSALPAEMHMQPAGDVLGLPDGHDLVCDPPGHQNELQIILPQVAKL